MFLSSANLLNVWGLGRRFLFLRVLVLYYNIVLYNNNHINNNNSNINNNDNMVPIPIPSGPSSPSRIMCPPMCRPLIYVNITNCKNIVIVYYIIVYIYIYIYIYIYTICPSSPSRMRPALRARGPARRS